MADTQTHSPQAEVTVSGTMRCIDLTGSRLLTPDEFHALIGRIADHFDDEASIVDPGIWGQASTGDVEMHFVVTDPGPHFPALNERVTRIIHCMTDAVGLIRADDPKPAPSKDPIAVLEQRGQDCHLLTV